MNTAINKNKPIIHQIVKVMKHVLSGTVAPEFHHELLFFPLRYFAETVWFDIALGLLHLSI
jgi:hypothetical protein